MEAYDLTRKSGRSSIFSIQSGFEGSVAGEASGIITSNRHFSRRATSDLEKKYGEIADRPGAWTFAVILHDAKTESVVAIIIMVNFVLICIDTDNVANEEVTSPWVLNAMHGCFVTYVVELVIRFYAHGLKTLKVAWNVMDFVIVVLGMAELVADQLESQELGPLSGVRVVRLARLMRLLRAMRLMSELKELRSLLSMIMCCFKTLFWSFAVCFMIMTIFATTAVTFINPLVEKLDEEGYWEAQNCRRCARAFSSVMRANLTLFQTSIAGDSWGEIAIPVITREPATAVIFIMSLLLIVFGVLNTIVAVLVDTFAEQREKDLIQKAQDLEREEREEKEELGKIFAMINSDGSGHLSLQQLEEGAARVDEFRTRLRVMDIGTEDLVQLFQMLDTDRNGEVDPEEFIEVLYRINHTVANTATSFVKHMASVMRKKQDEMLLHLVSLDSKVVKTARRLHSMSCYVKSCVPLDDGSALASQLAASPGPHSASEDAGDPGSPTSETEKAAKEHCASRGAVNGSAVRRAQLFPSGPSVPWAPGSPAASAASSVANEGSRGR